VQFLIILFLSAFSWAHELQYLGSHTKLNRQHLSGWTHDLLIKATLSPQHQLGLQYGYLERFDLYDQRLGGLYQWKPTDRWSFDFKYLKGSDVTILPEEQYLLSVYHALAPGLSPYLSYSNSRYTITHVQLVTLGLEIEKIKHFVLIPQVMRGESEFDRPEQTKSVYNYGLKIMYYREQEFSAALFGYQGREAAQGIIGESSFTINTRTVGGSLGYYVWSDLKSELIFDYTEYQKIQNQFLTTTLNIVKAF
jgi:hypothetical protein